MDNAELSIHRISLFVLCRILWAAYERWSRLATPPSSVGAVLPLNIRYLGVRAPVRGRERKGEELESVACTHGQDFCTGGVGEVVATAADRLGGVDGICGVDVEPAGGVARRGSRIVEGGGAVAER